MFAALGKRKDREYKIKCRATVFEASQNTVGQPTVKTLWVTPLSSKEKKAERKTIMKEENPVFPAQASSPARMGFQESSIHFRAEGSALGTPKWTHPNNILSWTLSLLPLCRMGKPLSNQQPQERLQECANWLWPLGQLSESQESKGSSGFRLHFN